MKKNTGGTAVPISRQVPSGVATGGYKPPSSEKAPLPPPTIPYRNFFEVFTSLLPSIMSYLLNSLSID